jgi:uncharacterized protein
MLVDANLLLFARDATSPRHEVARTWIEDVLTGPTRVGLPWVSLVAFVRIATHPRVYERPLSVADAWGQVEEWLDAPASWIPAPTEAHQLVLGGLLGEHQTTGNLVSDAHLAALAIEHGVELCSADSDFARFEGLRWRNPLAR